MALVTAVMQWHQAEYEVHTDVAAFDFDIIHGYLAKSYWSPGIPEATLRKALAGSLCFGMFAEGRQIGFARVISDRATFAYLCDVFVLPGFQGKGLGKWLMDCVMAHPDLQALRRMVLVTRDAHGLYREFGFTGLANPDGYMELHRPDIYRSEAPDLHRK